MLTSASAVLTRLEAELQLIPCWRARWSEREKAGPQTTGNLNVARCGGANEDGGERELSPGNRVEATSLTRSKGLYISTGLGILLLSDCFSLLLLSFVFVEFVVLFLYFLIRV